MQKEKQLELSTRSITNMAAIKKHIAADNPAAAERVIASLLSMTSQLAEQPMIGHTRQRSGTRQMVMPKYPYTIVYRVSASKVRIVAVYHQRQIIQGD